MLDGAGSELEFFLVRRIVYAELTRLPDGKNSSRRALGLAWLDSLSLSLSCAFAAAVASRQPPDSSIRYHALTRQASIVVTAKLAELHAIATLVYAKKQLLSA